MRVQPHCLVTLSYHLRDCSPAACSGPKGPFRMQVVVGHDRLPSALEQALLGAAAGDRIELDLPSAAWSDFPDRAGVIRLPLSRVIAAGEPQVGQVHHIMDENSTLKPIRLVAIENDWALADFRLSAPNASLHLDLTVESVRWANLDELKRILQPVAAGL